ncbi:hypothetical protein DL96DRAFT_1635705 [Flagelloscypha sp. PMI_526]|nr:hypothetical protein DL96DRAFT_1635705 [Flagelloscypha sp. PMI_526]
MVYFSHLFLSHSHLPMATPTPFGGTVQAPDIESNSIPPPRKFIFKRLRNPIRLETITSLASIAGLCIIAIAVPCFIVFSCVALGRVFVEGSGNNDPGKPRTNPNGEYVISVLAGFFLLLLATGTLTFLALSCENSLEKTFVQWVMVILTLFGFGPASVALSTRILQARIAHVVTGDIVVHYFAGCTTIGLSTFFLVCFFVVCCSGC